MARLEDLTTGTLVKGIIPDALTELLNAKWHGSDVLEVVYKDTAGRVGTEILFRDRESALQVLTVGRPWSFDGDARMFRLVSEAHRIRLVAAGILEVEGNRVRLISPERLPADWNPETDRRLTVWEMTHHLLRVYYHQKQGDAATAELLRKLGAKADVARDLAYKLFTVCEKNKWSAEAQGYNALVLGWPDLVKLAQERPATTPTPKQTEFI